MVYNGILGLREHAVILTCSILSSKLSKKCKTGSTKPPHATDAVAGTDTETNDFIREESREWLAQEKVDIFDMESTCHHVASHLGSFEAH